MARILLIAPTCDGTDIGEAWVAYQWASRLSSCHDLTVLTYRKRGRPPATSQLSGATVVEWLEPRFLGRAERLNSLLKPGYIAFYFRARRWIRRAQRSGVPFDVAHQPVPVATRYPSPAAGLGIPLIMGPVGGGLPDPPGFVGDPDSQPWYVRLRGLDAWRLRHDALLRRTYASANCVLAIAPYVAERLASVPLRRLVVLSETALDALPPDVEHAVAPSPARLLYVGRLVRTKGAREAIRALTMISATDVHLDIVGDGPDRAFCEELVADLGLAGSVTLHGYLPRSAIDTFYRRSDVFVFPSYREPGGNVVFEAMGHGLPLIVADRGGPASSVDDTCAIRVPVTTPEALAQDVARAVDELLADPVRRLAMGRAARRRVAEVGLWQTKIEAVNRLYEELIPAALDDDEHRPQVGT